MKKNNKDDLRTAKIMKQISLGEKRRLMVLLNFLVVSELILAITLFLSTRKTITNLVQTSFFLDIEYFEYKIEKLFPQIFHICCHLWDEIIRGVLALAIITFIFIVILFVKAKKENFSKRFREIGKFSK